MCYMWNGELRYGIPPNPILEAHYKAIFVKWLQYGKWCHNTGKNKSQPQTL